MLPIQTMYVMIMSCIAFDLLQTQLRTIATLAPSSTRMAASGASGYLSPAGPAGWRAPRRLFDKTCCAEVHDATIQGLRVGTVLEAPAPYRTLCWYQD